MTDKKTLCLDFDGVLHWYRNGWQDGTIYDIPAPGAQAAVEKYLEIFDVVICSSRFSTAAGMIGASNWMHEHKFPFGWTMQASKPPAHVTLDDRAVTFKGIFPDAEDLLKFTPWMNRPLVNVPTCDLVNELAKREGVEEYVIGMEKVDEFSICPSEDEAYGVDSPARVLVVTD